MTCCVDRFDGEALALVCLSYREADLDVTIERAQPDVSDEPAVIPVVDCQDIGPVSRIRWFRVMLNEDIEECSCFGLVGLNLAWQPLPTRRLVALGVYIRRIPDLKGSQDECFCLYPEQLSRFVFHITRLSVNLTSLMPQDRSSATQTISYQTRVSKCTGTSDNYLIMTPEDRDGLLKELCLNHTTDGLTVSPTYKTPFDVLAQRHEGEECGIPKLTLIEPLTFSLRRFSHCNLDFRWN